MAAKTTRVSIETHDAQDRILTRGTSVFNHSDHGDLELRTGGATSLALSYDELGNLLRAVSSDSFTQTTIEYKVDGLGRRVARMIGGKFDKAWLYLDSLRPVAEVTADGTFTHFVYASNHPLSGAPIALIRGGILYRVVKDHIGSVRLVVNAQTGAVAQSIDYDANGRVLSETGAGFQPFGFAGGLYDATTGLVRFGARDYDPEIGRWTNKDPIGFAGQQGNVYLYVGGDGVNASDPLGLVVQYCTHPIQRGPLFWVGQVTGWPHVFLKTDKYPQGVGLNGDGFWGRFGFLGSAVVGEDKRTSDNATCKQVYAVDEACVDAELSPSDAYHGVYLISDTCTTFANRVLYKCTRSPAPANGGGY